MADYWVEVHHIDRDAWIGQLEAAIVAELSALGVHTSLAVHVVVGPTAASPAVGVFLGSAAAAADPVLGAVVQSRLDAGRLIVPVVESLDTFATSVVPCLRPINGWEWVGTDPASRLARRLLEELGVEDRRRRAFISHRRDDGMAAAEQLHDFLVHHGFDPFIDRFGVGIGKDVQNEIADALEDCAFLLLLETPLAHTSPWVYDEVEYALSHQIGMHIVTWPGGVPELPATNRWPRQHLAATDLRAEKGYDVFTDAALEAVLVEVEAIHANALARRRRYMLRSVEDAARSAGLTATQLLDWRILVEGASQSVVQVTPRLPTVEDLHRLDTARTTVGPAGTPGLLVHATRALQEERRAVLGWAAAGRDLTVIPENAIGGHWV
ncbi:MAG: hypothetical protein JWR83_1618 [Aeromicrobium sp.]|nr:hypothetical protein [Aeromicrobium sp.]